MFTTSKTQIKFIRTLTLPGLGNVWNGRTAFVDKNRAAQLVQNKIAEFIENKESKQTPNNPKEKEDGKQGSKFKRSQATS